MLENTPKTEILGTDVYTFGLYCMIGAVCAVIAILFLCRNEKMKKGTGILLSCLCLLCGALFSRILFCLLHDVSMGGVPIDDWFRFSGGGFSLFGMVFGVFAGAFVCSLISGENRNKLLDISSCAIPLFIAAERFGEHAHFEKNFEASRYANAEGFALRMYRKLTENHGTK